jgi:multiple sugar transport system permease protein
VLPFKGRHLLFGYVLLLFAALVVALPFLWILLTSFKHEIAIYSGALWFEPTMQNYVDVVLGPRSNFPRNVQNSVIVASVSTCVVLVVGTLAAYSLARMRWAVWISRGFLGWTLFFHMIPVLTIVGPWYLLIQRIGLYDTLSSLILTHITINLPMTVWLMMTFFRDLPPELEEAASVDGARRAQSFLRVILPLAVPGLIAAGVLEFSVALNLTSRHAATVPVGIAQFVQQFEIQNGQMAAAASLSTIPALLLMLFGQRFVVQGLTVGTVK